MTWISGLVALAIFLLLFVVLALRWRRQCRDLISGKNVVSSSQKRDKTDERERLKLRVVGVGGIYVSVVLIIFFHCLRFYLLTSPFPWE